ncbi:efflux RND transporter periplasmic adaptor subunit [Cyanobium sp. WAJ14-Wanaka]|uniref:efflux RND transporter periplasmic adaptor subunit n=1 Tax=Cyanobium sp. WAJ14-Wanaka TaxID=2823725 RepID=UPI0020CC7101|nr:efflux RND transporter periplasmic adaptor subunit [Cyanobium sp. WAJ14-Wanaka]
MAALLTPVAPLRQLAAPCLLMAALTLGACQSSDPAAKRLPTVQAQPVALTRFSDLVDTISTLEAAQEVQLAAQASGRILQLLVRQGDAVRQGQLLLVLDQTQLRAEVASLRGQMQTSKLNYERYAYLVKQGAASSLQRDEARQSYIAAREALTARQADLAFRQLRAPISGTVADLVVKAGDVIQAGSPLTKMVGSGRLLARIDVPAIYADRLKPGLTVRLLDPINQRPIEVGVVNSVDPGVNVGSQSLLVKASFANGNPSLRNGLRLRTQLELGSYGALAVPFTAVSQMAGQSFVYVLGSRADLERRPGRGRPEATASLPPGSQFALQTPVQLGPLQGTSYPVIRGLQPGQRVVSAGLLNLRHGSAVKVGRVR